MFIKRLALNTLFTKTWLKGKKLMSYYDKKIIKNTQCSLAHCMTFYQVKGTTASLAVRKVETYRYVK